MTATAELSRRKERGGAGGALRVSRIRFAASRATGREQRSGARFGDCSERTGAARYDHEPPPARRPATFNKYESESLFFSSIARAALELAPELHLSLVLFD